MTVTTPVRRAARKIFSVLESENQAQQHTDGQDDEVVAQKAEDGVGGLIGDDGAREGRDEVANEDGGDGQALEKGPREEDHEGVDHEAVEDGEADDAVIGGGTDGIGALGAGGLALAEGLGVGFFHE